MNFVIFASKHSVTMCVHRLNKRIQIALATLKIPNYQSSIINDKLSAVTSGCFGRVVQVRSNEIHVESAEHLPICEIDIEQLRLATTPIEFRR